MTALSNSLVLVRNSPGHLSSGSFKPVDLGILHTTSLPVAPLRSRKAVQTHLVVHAAYRDGGRPNSADIFVGGFILGGLVVGALGCVYAPQISKALAGADKKELLRKLPKFIYDEEKALEKTRKVLTEKIEQLNSAIDDISGQLRSQGTVKPKKAAVKSEDVQGLGAAV